MDVFLIIPAISVKIGRCVEKMLVKERSVILEVEREVQFKKRSVDFWKLRQYCSLKREV